MSFVLTRFGLFLPIILHSPPHNITQHHFSRCLSSPVPIPNHFFRNWTRKEDQRAAGKSPTQKHKHEKKQSILLLRYGSQEMDESTTHFYMNDTRRRVLVSSPANTFAIRSFAVSVFRFHSSIIPISFPACPNSSVYTIFGLLVHQPRHFFSTSSLPASFREERSVEDLLSILIMNSLTHS